MSDKRTVQSVTTTNVYDVEGRLTDQTVKTTVDEWDNTAKKETSEDGFVPTSEMTYKEFVDGIAGEGIVLHPITKELGEQLPDEALCVELEGQLYRLVPEVPVKPELIGKGDIKLGEGRNPSEHVYPGVDTTFQTFEIDGKNYFLNLSWRHGAKLPHAFNLSTKPY